MFKFLKEKLKNWIKKTVEPKTKKIKAEKAKLPAKIPEKKKIKEKESREEKPKDSTKIGGWDTSQTSTSQEEKTEIQEIAEKELPQEEKAKSRFDWFRKKLTQEKFEELFEQLELILLQNNVALEVAEQIKKNLEKELIGKNLSDINLEEKLKQSINEILQNSPDIIKEMKKSLAVKQPFVIIFVGINGSGKTTSIAKLAYLLKKSGFSVCLAAADTFRAASIEQLQKHAENLNIPIIKKDYGSDPASVGFDAVQYAKKHHIDIVLIDTAGRMQNKDSLMKELEKISRINKPDLTLFVGESITGNDATLQAKTFAETINIDGIIFSKADIDEKAGAILSVSYVTKKPIFFLGTGQSYEDFEVFNKEKIMKKLGL